MERKSFYSITGLILCLFLLVLVGGCKDKPKPGNGQTGFEQSLTNKDSVEVTNLVNTFFGYAESGNYNAAVAMLYKNNVDSVYEAPQPLSNEEMGRVKGILSSLPIKRHTIDYIKFKQTYENEVKCSALIMEGHDGIPEVKTSFYFKPINHMGTWRLCMVDSHHGDQTVIAPDKKDSMKNEYQREMAEKKLSRLKHQ